MNHNFATVDTDHRIVYAPDTLGRSLRAPTPWQYNTANYWKLDNTVPEAPEGKYAVVSMLGGAELGEIVTIQEEHVPELDENGEQLDPNDEYKPLVKVVRQRYEFAPIPAPPSPPPRIFSKLYLILSLQKRGLYDQFKAMLEAAGLGDLWLAANELNDGFEGFAEYVAQAKAALGLTDAQVEEILGEAVAR